MTFVQLIDCRTSRFDEMDRLMDTWVEQTKGKRTATHAVVGKDRSDTSHFVEIVEFPSYEEAMRNSGLPETERIFQGMLALCDEMPTFTDLDVVRDEQLNPATSRQFFERAGRAGTDAVFEGFSDDYLEHDPANSGAVDLEGSRQVYAGWRQAFDLAFRVDDQIAQDDRVCTRWTLAGRHKGDFLGIPATGQDVTMSGMTWHRFRDGLICEGWWQYDRAGLMEQLGAFGE
ncbi:ester cyclase [Streptomyces pseudovenezuelae]|uniref:ester cyclase n=1 Tax=Streptomyces pseudovenezuelae TaxID=67350 RepID=UPI002E810DD5|nr:ester cyclase [Streptomyces pseudovenezuelae]WUA89072.1 ester cyclase [Streptomyces pseudovenezuelae]